MIVDLEKLRKARDTWFNRPPEFCDICGDTEPESLFYPLGIFYGPSSISGLICNDCEQKLRKSHIKVE